MPTQSKRACNGCSPSYSKFQWWHYEKRPGKKKKLGKNTHIIPFYSYKRPWPAMPTNDFRLLPKTERVFTDKERSHLLLWITQGIHIILFGMQPPHAWMKTLQLYIPVAPSLSLKSLSQSPVASLLITARRMVERHTYTKLWTNKANSVVGK